jgi:hypothetical protein
VLGTILANSDKCGKMLANEAKYWQLWQSTGKCSKLCTGKCGKYWQKWQSTAEFWQMWQILATVAKYWQM